MKKQSIMYDITIETFSDTKLGGKIGRRMIAETVTDLNLTGIKKVLTECLDLAIKSNGKPFRPTLDDIRKSMGSFCDSEKWLKKQTKLYQKAYDLYDDIIGVINKNNASRQETGIFYRNFKPFNMYITIKVC